MSGNEPASGWTEWLGNWLALGIIAAIIVLACLGGWELGRGG